MAYTDRRTGSARSVGNRRRIKYYATADDRAVAARSAAGARQDAKLAGTTATGAFATEAQKAAGIIDRLIPSTVKPKAAGGTQTQTGTGAGGGGGNANDLGATNTAAEAAADLAALANVVAKPTTAWTTGQFVTLKDGSKAHWDGNAWQAGAA